MSAEGIVPILRSDRPVPPADPESRLVGGGSAYAQVRVPWLPSTLQTLPFI
ncbi:MAG: hypothetical protein OXG81_08605 [Acidobacteria bacterium]|nr:hypothetical protein [Acidobacteriota bacterium]